MEPLEKMSVFVAYGVFSIADVEVDRINQVGRLMGTVKIRPVDTLMERVYQPRIIKKTPPGLGLQATDIYQYESLLSSRHIRLLSLLR